jgi:2-polyprenyl-6-methoxyphenol hydroxylase-like FAD-dependent oxidoreductase
MREAGLAERVLGSAYLVKQWNLAGRDGVRVRVGLGAGEELAVLRQDVLESMLERALNELGVRVEWRQEVAKLESGGESVRATISRYEKQSRGYIVAHTEWMVAGWSELDVEYVVGADGYNSRVRRALHYDFPEVGPAEYYAVFEFGTDADLRHEMTVALGDGTCDVLWPLPGGDARWSFRLPEHHDAGAEEVKDVLDRSGFGHFPTERTKDRMLNAEGEREAALTEASLRRLIAERAPWFDASQIGDLRWRTVVRFERRMATGFGRGRLWLAGDAAHLTGPVGIQSMNAGLAEGHGLALALAAVLRDGASPALLDGCAQRAAQVWRQLHGQEGGLRAESDCDPVIAAHAGEMLSALPATGAALEPLARRIGLGLAARGAARMS